MPTETIDRRTVLAFRFHRQQLDRDPETASGPGDVDLLDYGVQDTGPDGAAWAMASRGGSPAVGGALVVAWTIRGAPHVYRRDDISAVAVATAPFSDADAAKRIYDAARPLREAGIAPLDALRTVADQMRRIVKRPTAKGDLSARLTDALDPPYLRHCQPCAAIHCYEMPFRLAALQAGLELAPGTSPPMLERVRGLRVPGYRHLGGDADPRLDVVRNHLRFYGPTVVGDVAGFLDAPKADVRAHWPEDTIDVSVLGATRSLLAGDLDELRAAEARRGVVRLLGPFDPYLQLRDRELLVADSERRKDVWRTLGRPGAIVADGEVLGSWRPRTSGRRLTVLIDPWRRFRADERARLDAEAERLATHRDVRLAAVERA